MIIIHNNIYQFNRINFNNISSKNSNSPKLINLRSITNNANIENNPLHAHKQLEIFYFFEGYGCFSTPSSNYDIKPNTLIIVNATNLHCQYTTQKDNPLRYCSLLIDDIYLNNFPRNIISKNEYEAYHFESNENIFYSNLNMILTELNKNELDYQHKIYHLFQIFIIEILRLANYTYEPLNTNFKTLDFVKKAKEYIDQNFLDNITLSSLAKIVYTSKEYLCKKFSETYKISPIQYLSHTRIEHAKFLLETTNSSISDIAISSGINGPAYFSELFKKIVGITPRSYIKKLKQIYK